MTRITERKEIQTVADLVTAIEKMTGPGIARLDEMYIKDFMGDEINEVCLEQETLSDGSVAFNICLGYVGDPNS